MNCVSTGLVLSLPKYQRPICEALHLIQNYISSNLGYFVLFELLQQTIVDQETLLAKRRNFLTESKEFWRKKRTSRQETIISREKKANPVGKCFFFAKRRNFLSKSCFFRFETGKFPIESSLFWPKEGTSYQKVMSFGEKEELPDRKRSFLAKRKQIPLESISFSRKEASFDRKEERNRLLGVIVCLF